ncbi:MAG: hypothetical protein K9J37_05410 [Saprospiraceae bacterium]|nr:hypothetical protein [Saprospiraceae bacterium]MCF8249327.1 hypothetical protein [Saprospiraceae bacterium]MCF8279748.1 hypothetical protein [Bacteroidales bacterium]MCF8311396.1 hypothetical protein [Saprospiraceae bacterium]MCF8439946.1 hypothetical protein [Saprospiraceae bacterium]
MLYRDYFPPMLPGVYYHVFNRGNNKQNLFYKAKNYGFFLEKYKHYLSLWLDSFAYCLLPNHFHLLVRVKPAEVFFGAKEFWKFVKGCKDPTGFENLSGLVGEGKDLTGLQDLSSLSTQQEAQFYVACAAFISEQFRLLFMSYSKAINKQEGRTGSLFERPFKRLVVKDERHFGNLVFYINANAQLHRISDDFREYPHCSYAAYLSTAATKLERDEVIAWFGSRENLVSAHQQQMDFKKIAHLIIEDD